MNENRELSDAEESDIQAEPGTSIVVGHDRSAGADVALEVALQLASELRAPVTIVRAWSFVTAPRPGNWTFGYVSSVDELAQAVRPNSAPICKLGWPTSLLCL